MRAQAARGRVERPGRRPSAPALRFRHLLLWDGHRRSYADLVGWWVVNSPRSRGAPGPRAETSYRPGAVTAESWSEPGSHWRAAGQSGSRSASSAAQRGSRGAPASSSATTTGKASGTGPGHSSRQSGLNGSPRINDSRIIGARSMTSPSIGYVSPSVGESSNTSATDTSSEPAVGSRHRRHSPDQRPRSTPVTAKPPATASTSRSATTSTSGSTRTVPDEASSTTALACNVRCSPTLRRISAMWNNKAVSRVPDRKRPPRLILRRPHTRRQPGPIPTRQSWSRVSGGRR